MAWRTSASSASPSMSPTGFSRRPRELSLSPIPRATNSTHAIWRPALQLVISPLSSWMRAKGSCRRLSATPSFARCSEFVKSCWLSTRWTLSASGSAPSRRSPPGFPRLRRGSATYPSGRSRWRHDLATTLPPGRPGWRGIAGRPCLNTFIRSRSAMTAAGAPFAFPCSGSTVRTASSAAIAGRSLQGRSHQARTC